MSTPALDKTKGNAENQYETKSRVEYFTVKMTSSEREKLILCGNNKKNLMYVANI